MNQQRLLLKGTGSKILWQQYISFFSKYHDNEWLKILSKMSWRHLWTTPNILLLKINSAGARSIPCSADDGSGNGCGSRQTLLLLAGAIFRSWIQRFSRRFVAFIYRCLITQDKITKWRQNHNTMYQSRSKDIRHKNITSLSHSTD